MKPQLLVLFAALSLTASAAAPAGWMVAGNAPKDYDFGTDVQAADGSKSAFIKAKASAASSGFGTLMQMVSADEYRGGRWKLSARMRTDDAIKAQMWMRVDGPNAAMYAFDNMDDRPVSGDTAVEALRDRARRAGRQRGCGLRFLPVRRRRSLGR